MRYVQICKRCGRVFPREENLCPKCGFDKEAHRQEILSAKKHAANRELTVSVNLRVSTHYKTCASCKLLIPKTQKKCPLCGGVAFNKYYYCLREPSLSHRHRAGTGRGYHGEACDICPTCHGTPDWCPLLD